MLSVMDRRTDADHLRRLLNWLNLSTLLGLALAWAGRCRLSRGPNRLILAEHYRFSFPVARAFTVGNVVITSSTFSELEARFPRILDHETKHATQWAACWGLPFLPLYLLAMGWSWVRSGDRASHNVFEVAAGLRSGGYRRLPTRARGFWSWLKNRPHEFASKVNLTRRRSR